MRGFTNKQVSLLVGVLCVSLLSGCTNWRERYELTNAQAEHTKGKLAESEAEKAAMQKQLDDLNSRIQAGQPAADATGFPGMDVTVNPGAGTITVTLPDSILFASGQATLKGSTSQQLDKIASVVKEKYEGKQVDVVGHTDNEPIRRSTWQDNLQLSTERANTVTRYLIKQGIPQALIRSVGCGEARPVADNSSAGGRAKNRRVEIVVFMK
jgi:chemotaxis protein MotB